MNSRTRLLTALGGGEPDRLPVTTHHLMPYFLTTYLNGMSESEFFGRFGLDPITWVWDLTPEESHGEFSMVVGEGMAGEGNRWMCADDWRIEASRLPHTRNKATRYDIVTPSGTLTTVLEERSQTVWVVERLIKRKSDIELIAKHAVSPSCDVETVNRKAGALHDRGILRGAVPGFEIYGQPGCWQDAAVLVGIVELIEATFEDPVWVHELLGILRDRKLESIESMAGARLDVIELGGGDASSTVISPTIFTEFVAPYDAQLIAALHRVGQRVVYHTCGGMMPILELIADMHPDAMETFTPPTLGGDVDLAEAKRRIGDRVCMIGGFDQCSYLAGCTPDETRRAVRKCFAEAGAGGGYILAPSDHFFDADVALIQAFAEEARSCVYGG